MATVKFSTKGDMGRELLAATVSRKIANLAIFTIPYNYFIINLSLI